MREATTPLLRLVVTLGAGLVVAMVGFVVLPERLVVVRSGIAGGLRLVIGSLGSSNGLVSRTLGTLSGGNALIGSYLGLLRRSLAFTGQSDSLIGSRLSALYVFDRGATTKQCCRNQTIIASLRILISSVRLKAELDRI